MNSTQFRKIFYPYHTKLYSIAYRMLMDAPTAEDMVQEVFLKLWSHRYGLVAIENTEAYSVTMLKNMCINHIRSRNSKNIVQYNYDVAETDSLSAQIENKDSVKRLNQLIARLPEQQRQVIQLRHYEDCSYEEMEERMGVNAAHLRVILSRARKTIREQFVKIEQI